METDKKDGRMRELIRKLATDFIQSESNHQSLITVTEIKLTEHNKEATILLTVFPETAEVEALDFLKRQRGAFKKFVMEKSGLGRIPFFDFVIDSGEKNRQKIDKLSVINKRRSGEVG